MKLGDGRKMFRSPRTFGERSADKLAEWAGSWTFIILFIFILIVWMGVNTYGYLNISSWDNYPFILLNLVLSCIAALQAPRAPIGVGGAARTRRGSLHAWSIRWESARAFRDVRSATVPVPDLSRQPRAGWLHGAVCSMRQLMISGLRWKGKKVPCRLNVL